MVALCAVLSALAISLSPPIVGEKAGAPAWINQLWVEEAPQLASTLVGGPTAILELAAGEHAHPGHGRLNGVARADGLVTVHVAGSAWDTPTDRAVAEVRQIFAHELAHVWQLSVLDDADEPLWFHEGIADALALVMLEEAGLWTDYDVAVWRRQADMDCAKILSEGPLVERFKEDDRDAIYACSAVVVDVLADGEDLRLLYQRYAGAAAETDASAALEEIGPPNIGMQVATFLNTSWTHILDPVTVIADFRAGRL